MNRLSVVAGPRKATKPSANNGKSARPSADSQLLRPLGATDLTSALRDACTTLSRACGHHGSLEFRAPIGSCVMPSSEAMTLVLIVTQAVTNAIKYSHPAGGPGKIIVCCCRDPDGTIAIDVIDDGVGLPENFDTTADGGSGFKIMRALSESLGATLGFNSTSLGLAVRLRVPPASACGQDAPPARVSLREHASRLLASIVETSNDAIVGKDLNGIVTSWNRGAERLFGYTAEEMIGKSITILFPADRQNEEAEILDRVRRGERIDHYETVRQRKDGSFVDISLSVSPIMDAAGGVIGASKIARDITERKEARAREQLLAQEIQHRTKNLFAVVQAVVARSFAGKQSVEEAEAAVLDRLRSLAQTHVMLIDKEWQGADLCEVVRLEMSPYADRVQIDGPSLMLNAKAAQTFALAVHELATNAAKYGALSNANGRVNISWSVQRSNGSGLFTFGWRERDGPPVSPSGQKGFGAVVLEQVVADYFEVTPLIVFDRSGLRYELRGPLDALATVAHP
jgi:PAS domain S-box-containing protein